MANEKILVADDEVQYVDVIACKFRNAGLTVITAGNGREALDLARKEKPDLVITDYQMPEMDGLALCAAMRKDPTLALTPVILLTAYGMIIEETEQSTAEITAMMPKPFSPRELLAKVRELLDQAGTPTAMGERK
jgi:two-component system, OmpR family, alkaline phosphatase synthesis response regulator PhoP